MPYSQENISQDIREWDTILDNIEHDRVLRDLADKRKYTGEVRLALRTDLEDLKELVEQRRVEYAEQSQATENVKNLLVSTYDTTLRFMEQGRKLFGEKPAIYAELKLAGRRKRSKSGFLEQASQFYTNLLAEENIIRAYGDIGVTLEELQKGLEAVNELKKAMIIQARESAEAEESTQNRDRVYDALDMQMNKMVGLMSLELKDDQKLEKLGKKVK